MHSLMTKEEFKEMTFRQKLRWLFDYYSLPLIAVLGVLIVMWILIKSIFLPEETEDVCVLIYSDKVTQEECLTYESEIEEKTGKSVSIQVISVSDPYGSQAFAAKIGCDVIDLVIAPENEMKLMSENGFLLSYAPVESKDMYMGVPKSAREDDLLKIVIDYLDEKL